MKQLAIASHERNNLTREDVIPARRSVSGRGPSTKAKQHLATDPLTPPRKRAHGPATRSPAGNRAELRFLHFLPPAQEPKHKRRTRTILDDADKVPAHDSLAKKTIHAARGPGGFGDLASTSGGATAEVLKSLPSFKTKEKDMSKDKVEDSSTSDAPVLSINTDILAKNEGFTLAALNAAPSPDSPLLSAPINVDERRNDDDGIDEAPLELTFWEMHGEDDVYVLFLILIL